MDKEAGALHLLDVVESDQTDVGIGEGLGAAGNLLQHLRAVSAAEHGELPHGPVTVVIVVDGGIPHSVGVGGLDVGGLGARELEAGGVAIADNVVNLLGDLRVGESGQVGECLEEPDGGEGGEGKRNECVSEGELERDASTLIRDVG